MKRDDVLATLRAHEQELRDLGILRVAVAGSTARNEAGDDSDVDLVADFDKAVLTLIDLVGLEHRIEVMLGAQVDLLDRDTLSDRVRERVEAEAVLAF